MPLAEMHSLPRQKSFRQCVKDMCHRGVRLRRVECAASVRDSTSVAGRPFRRPALPPFLSPRRSRLREGVCVLWGGRRGKVSCAVCPRPSPHTTADAHPSAGAWVAGGGWWNSKTQPSAVPLRTHRNAASRRRRRQSPRGCRGGDRHAASGLPDNRESFVAAAAAARTGAANTPAGTAADDRGCRTPR